MGDVLDQSEVDALLAAVDGREIEVEVPEGRPSRQVSVHDFKRPERVSKEQIRSLEVLHEVFCRNLGASLSALLRTIVEIRLQSVDQLTYSEFIMSLPNPTCFNLLSCAPLEGNVILEMNPSIVFPIIDRELGGGRIASSPPERALTDIEWRLVGGIIDRALDQLRAVWSSVQPLDFRVKATESNPQLMPIVAPNELVVLISFDVVMGDSRGWMNFCIPFLVIEPIMGEITAHTWFGYARKDSGALHRDQILKNVGEAHIDLVCYLAETSIRVRDFLELRPGDVLPTRIHCKSSLPLRVHGKPKFMVRPGRLRDRKAVQVTGEVRDARRDPLPAIAPPVPPPPPRMEMSKS